ncbi:MAG: putative methyltransferase [Promethearchaeota archaeon CR_4]|nr:MAG: putative methyltransferase [Candidatus Lokiarchaeota archaeon CR_4]
MPLAFWNQLKFEVPEGVYHPAEDTYLSLDFLAEQISSDNPSRMCELGCGSGIIGISLAILNPQSEVILADINPLAVTTTEVNARRHNIRNRIAILESNLFEKIPQEQKFDWIIFNPPYLPASGELESTALREQTEGGESGLKIIRQFLVKLPTFLKKAGKAFFIASSLSSLSELESISEKMYLLLERKKSIHLFFEDIILFEVTCI